MLDSGGVKTVKSGPDYRPDTRYYHPSSLGTLTNDDVLWGASDALTHGVEEFLSPLADEPLRAQLAKVIRQMLILGPTREMGWFELSARATEGDPVTYIPSGDWKTLVDEKVTSEEFNTCILSLSGSGGEVIECYWLVEKRYDLR